MLILIFGGFKTYIEITRKRNKIFLNFYSIFYRKLKLREMKIIVALFITFLFTNIVFAQKELKEKTLQEIDSLVANSLEFLGKTDSAIMAAGRPSSIIGGDKWEAKSFKGSNKNAMDSGKSIIIGTGCGGLMLMVSAKSNLVYAITFIPHKKSKLDGARIMNYLGSKYQFDKTGTSIIKAKDSSYIGLSALTGAIFIAALKEDKKTLRFSD